MASYEATIRVTHISTSSKARSGLSVGDAVGAAKAHLNYITRDDAAEAGNVLAWSNGEALTGSTDELKAAARDAIDQRAEKHNEANGVRLADKLIVSFPNDATIPEQRQMCLGILSEFCGKSEAFGIAAIHTDTAGNKHGHFEFFDGKETREDAIARRPDAQRVRQADHLRMNEGGNRQDIRRRVAQEINGIAKSAHRRMAEYRSFKDRGIDKEPQKHEGPQVSNKLDRRPDSPRAITGGVLSRLKSNAIALRKRLEKDAMKGASILASDIPKRYGKGWLGGSWTSWLRQTNKKRTRGQDQTTQDAIFNGMSEWVSDWAEQTQSSITPISKQLPTPTTNPTAPGQRVRPAYMPPKVPTVPAVETIAPDKTQQKPQQRKKRRDDYER